MERHPALQDLSRDHHQLLVLCTHVQRAHAGEPGALSQERAAADLARAWSGDLPAHMREEEEVLLPALSRQGPVHEVEPVPLLHDDHAWFRDRFEALVDAVAQDEPAADLALDVADRLRRHVEMEERVLLESVTSRLDEAALKEVGEASQRFREAHRGPESIGPRTDD